MTTTRLVTGAAELASWRPAWQDLARSTDEPNVFFEPFFLLSALRQLAGAADVSTLLVLDGDRLLGLLPLERRRRYLGLPLPHLRLWKHRFCFLCTPLVRSGEQDRVAEAILDWLDGQTPRVSLLHLDLQAQGGAFDTALRRAAPSRGRCLWTADSHPRAMLASDLDGDAYLRSALARKKRKELRRQRNRLEDLGPVRFEELRDPASLDAWLPRFVELEHRGWKGQAGSSIAARADSRAFLSELRTEVGDSGQLGVAVLQAGDRPVAMGLSLYSGHGAFAFKIAYDEQHARLSPGVQLEVALLYQLLAGKDVAWMDSCATPDHPMIDSLWAERRWISRANLTSDDRVGATLGRTTCQLHHLAKRARTQVEALGPGLKEPLRALRDRVSA